VKEEEEDWALEEESDEEAACESPNEDGGEEVPHYRHGRRRSEEMDPGLMQNLSITGPGAAASPKRGSDAPVLPRERSTSVYEEAAANKAERGQRQRIEDGIVYKGEPLLGYWFEESLHALDRYLKRKEGGGEQFAHLPGEAPRNHRTELRQFDWHGSVKQNGEKRTVDMLWKECAPKLREFGVTSGVYYPGQKCGARLRLDRIQHGVFRFNCADSLDRTNLCCFFASLHALCEQFRCLSLSPGLVPSDCDGFEPPREHSQVQCGLEGEEWCLLGFKDHEQALREIPPAVLSAHAASFVCNGDVCATAYCNSPAMHSGLLRSYAGDAVVKGQSNLAIAVKRRIANQFTDRRRTQSINFMLGRHWHKYLPTAESKVQRQIFADHCALVLLDPVSEAEHKKGGGGLRAPSRDVLSQTLPSAPSLILFNDPSRSPFAALYKSSHAPHRPAALLVFPSTEAAGAAQVALTSGSLSYPAHLTLIVSGTEYLRYYERWWEWLFHKEEGAKQMAKQILTDVRTGLGSAISKGWKGLKHLRNR